MVMQPAEAASDNGKKDNSRFPPDCLSETLEQVSLLYDRPLRA